ncbi:MAG: glycosyltransferase family 39 protein [Chloroflexi bacterium]|nr:glycosyltransferase family 39 protein [Chloroflexota bacterium]
MASGCFFADIFTLALQTAVSKFFTMDEPVHIIRGQRCGRRVILACNMNTRLLAHWAIGALLPLADNLPAIAQLPDWQTVQHIPLTEQFLWLADPPLNLALVTLLARLPVIFAGLLLGAALAAWSKQMALPGQMAVLILYAFSPNLLAHFSLATTDGVLTAVFTLSLFALWRFWQRPGLGRWLLAAGLLGLALVAKLTALLLLPLGLILSYASAYENKPQSAWRTRRKKIAGLKPLSWWQPGLIWLAMLPAAGLVVWALYSFDLTPAALAQPAPAGRRLLQQPARSAPPYGGRTCQLYARPALGCRLVELFSGGLQRQNPGRHVGAAGRGAGPAHPSTALAADDLLVAAAAGLVCNGQFGPG